MWFILFFLLQRKVFGNFNSLNHLLQQKTEICLICLHHTSIKQYYFNWQRIFLLQEHCNLTKRSKAIELNNSQYWKITKKKNLIRHQKNIYYQTKYKIWYGFSAISMYLLMLLVNYLQCSPSVGTWYKSTFCCDPTKLPVLQGCYSNCCKTYKQCKMWAYLLEKVKRGVLCINLPPDLEKGFAECTGLFV